MLSRALGAHDVTIVEADLGDEDGCKLALSKTLEHYNKCECNSVFLLLLGRPFKPFKFGNQFGF